MKSLEERFFAKVDKNGPTMPGMSTPCHVWTGARFEQGYGAFQYATRDTRRAHRVARAFEKGEVTSGMDVLHHCDNPPCVRGDHLYEGTDVENARDRVVRGRAASGDRHGSRTHPERRPRGSAHWTVQRPKAVVRGEQHGQAILSDARVAALRAEHTGKHGDTSRLARKYNISTTHARRIVLNETRKNVEGEK